MKEMEPTKGYEVSIKSSIAQENPINRLIKITINAIENIAEKESIGVFFTIGHENVTLAESHFITVEPDVREPPTVYDVNFTIELPVVINNRSSIDPIVSTPILIKTMRDLKTESISSTTNTESKKKGKSSIGNTSTASNLIGISNLDLMPIFLGEKYFTEKLLVETPYISFDGTAVSWQNLPLLTVTVAQDAPEFFLTDMKVNFLTITVESIYNISPSFMENFEYKAGTIVYVDDQVPENIIFEGGKWSKYRDVERIKQWRTLWELKSRAKYSKYKLSSDNDAIKNPFGKELDLKKKMWEDIPRIEWNSMDRCILYQSGAHLMREHITKFKYWPLQFVLSNKSSIGNKAKTKSESVNHQLYQCYIDSTELLFPGKTSTRVLAQLYTCNTEDMKEKTGLEKIIFDGNDQTIKEKEKKNKTMTKSASQSIHSDVERLVSTPQIAENGEPVFVIIEIELYRPLIASSIKEDFSHLIDKITSKLEDVRPYPYSSNTADEQYLNCIRKLVEIITENYQDFCNENLKEKSFNSKQTELKCRYVPELDFQDELTRFTQYLYKTGTYLAVRNALKNKVVTLLDQKFKIPLNIQDSVKNQNFITLIYTYLVERMHIAVNTVIEGRFTEDSVSEVIDFENLFFFADEAYELNHTDVAKRYYTMAITSDKSNPKAWIKYAVFLLKTDDIEGAVECCRKAILLNSRDRIALITYAAILTAKRDYRQAEVFFKAVVDMYPRFAEGWAILHLFYIRTAYYPGIDLTIRIAEKCMKDKNRETIDPDQKEPFAWSTIHCPRNNVYMTTAIFLFKLYLCDLAGIALAQEMSVASRSAHVLYYLAVQCYLLRRYEDSLSHLTEVQCSYGMDYSVASLMGHCYFQEGDIQKAINCYEFANTVFDRPDDLHLLQVRLGLYYNDVKRYHDSKKAFLNVCQTSPSPESWLGAGIAFYHVKIIELNQFKEAEAALTEANKLDNNNPDIWGFLCLINISLQRVDEFIQCFRQSIKNSLQNVKLWRMITESVDAHGYTSLSLTTILKENIISED